MNATPTPFPQEPLPAPSVLNGLKASFHTLGCKLNFAETSALAQALHTLGVQTVLPHEEPDLCLVNTCSVTDTADKKCRSLIRRLHRLHPEAMIGVTGCYAQLKGEALAALPGVVAVTGTARKQELIALLQEYLQTHSIRSAATPDPQLFEPACSREGRTRYFLKVQDGCNYFCTYCTIPMARGRSRNGSIALLVRQAQEVARLGGKEIVLTGVNIGDYGRSTGETLPNLLRALVAVDGIERLRIGSIEPDLLTDELIDLVAAQPKLMPHFHIPLQSGSDEVLKLMHRHYTTELFARKTRQILQVLPDAFIGIDVIAGMRGETDEHWGETKQFLQEIPFAALHVFPYSERAGTRALSITPVVPEPVKAMRVSELISLSEQKYALFAQRFAGTVRPVLWERKQDAQGVIHGFTDNYLRVAYPYNESLPERILPARLGPYNAARDALSVTLL